jgi:hypothetical protein
MRWFSSTWTDCHSEISQCGQKGDPREVLPLSIVFLAHDPCFVQCPEIGEPLLHRVFAIPAPKLPNNEWPFTGSDKLQFDLFKTFQQQPKSWILAGRASVYTWGGQLLNGNKTKNSSHIEIDGSGSTQEPTSWDNQNYSKAEQCIVWVSNNHFSILYKQAPKLSIELYLWVV